MHTKPNNIRIFLVVLALAATFFLQHISGEPGTAGTPAGFTEGFPPLTGLLLLPA